MLVQPVLSYAVWLVSLVCDPLDVVRERIMRQNASVSTDWYVQSLL